MKIKPKLLRIVTDARVVPWHLGKTLRTLEGDFEIYVAGDFVSQYESLFPGITFVDLPIQPKINLFRDLKGLFYLVVLIFKIKPKIVHSIMPKAGLLTALASFFLVPIRLHTFTGLVWQTKSGFSKSALRLLDKLVVKLNTLCMTDSFSQSEFLFKEGIRTRENEPLPVISRGSLGGVDLDIIDINNKALWRNQIRHTYNIPEGKFVIGYLARKTSDKGAMLMLDVFQVLAAINDNVVLMFIGPDDSAGELDKYKSRQPNWNKSVIEIDAVESHQKYLSAFDVLCLPSFREGFGSIVIDAAALSVPTVGSKIFGLTDAIVENETGLLFECGNKDELIKSINLLLGNDNLVDKLGKAAYQRTVKFFDYKILSMELASLYIELITRNTK